MRRRVRWWIWVPLGILGLVITVVMLALSASVQTVIAHRFIESFNQSIRGSLSVGSVHVTLGGIVSVTDVKLKDTDGSEVLSFASLEGRVDLWGLRSRSVRIFNLGIDSLRFRIALDSVGKSNLEHALAPKDTMPPPPDTTKPAAWALRLGNVTIHGGPALIYNPSDTLLNTKQWTLKADAKFQERKLDYRVEYDSPTQVHLKSEGSGVMGDTLHDIEGKVSLRVDSTYTGGHSIPVNTVGRALADVSYRQRADSMDVETALESSVLGVLRGKATMMFPPGKIAGHGDFAFEHLKPASLWHDTTNLDLSGTLAFAKDTSQAMVNGWEVRLRVQDTRYARYRLNAGELRIVTKDSTATIQGDLDTGSGRVGIDATVEGFVPQQMDVRADLRLSSVKLHDLISQVPDSLSPLTGTIHVRGQNIASESQRQIATVANLDPFTFGHYQVDTLAWRAAVNGDHILVDTLTLHGYGVSLEGQAEGELKGNMAYTARASIPDMRDIKSLLAAVSDSLDTVRGAVTLDLKGVADWSGSQAKLTTEGSVFLREASYGQYYAKSADIRLMQWETRSMTFGAAILADSIVVAGRHIDSVDVQVSGNREQFATALNAWANADTIFVRANFTTRFEGQTTVITLDSLYTRAYGVEAVSESPSTVSFSRERIEVDALQVRSNMGVLRASGFLQRHGEQDIAIELSGLRTGELAQLLKRPLPESTTNIRVQFTGTDADLLGDLSFVADSIVYNRKLVADHLVVEATANNKVTTVNGVLVMQGDTSAVFGGEIPLQISFGSGVVLRQNDTISGRVKIIEQRLAGFSQFLSSGTAIDGFIAGDATFRGTPANPQWLGTFVVRDATYRDGRTGVNYRDIDLQGELVNDTLRIPQISMRSVGRMTGNGSAVMAFPLPKDLALRLHMDRFEIMNNAQMSIRTSGDVNVSGPFKALHAQGDLKFDEIIYHLTDASTKSIEEVNIDSVLAVMRGDTAAAKESPFSPTAIYRSMSTELHLSIPGNCWVRGNGMNIELGGELWMYKDNGVNPTISGSIQTRQGKVVILSRRFEVTSGQISFEGPIGDPQIDVLAEYKPPEQSTAIQTLRVHVYGTVQETRMEFEGVTTEEAVLMLLGTGGGSNTAQMVEQTATGAATGQLTNFVGAMAGLDVFEYRPGSADGSLTGGTLEVGSYVTERLFVRVKQPVETGGTGQAGRVVNVEYRLLDWLKLRAERDATGASALDLLLQVDWR
jgi:autotransporter translocation and assembly factor TamB